MNSGVPWFAIFGFVIGVELMLIVTGRRTLSQRARDAARHRPWLPWLVMGLTVVLFGHFWLGWLWN